MNKKKFPEINDLPEDGEINDYESLTMATDSFSRKMQEFWNSLAFSEIIDENPDITEKILTVVRKLPADQYEDSFFIRGLRRKFEIISEFDPRKRENTQVCSQNGEYATIEMFLYSNGVLHNQHEVVLTMDEIEFIIDFTEGNVSGDSKDIDDKYL